MNKLFVAFGSFCLCTLSFAKNPLSVHVLNTETGLPSANISVVLEAQQGDKWVKLN